MDIRFNNVWKPIQTKVNIQNEDSITPIQDLVKELNSKSIKSGQTGN